MKPFDFHTASAMSCETAEMKAMNTVTNKSNKRLNKKFFFQIMYFKKFDFLCCIFFKKIFFLGMFAVLFFKPEVCDQQPAV